MGRSNVFYYGQLLELERWAVPEQRELLHTETGVSVCSSLCVCVVTEWPKCSFCWNETTEVVWVEQTRRVTSAAKPEELGLEQETSDLCFSSSFQRVSLFPLQLLSSWACCACMRFADVTMCCFSCLSMCTKLSCLRTLQCFYLVWCAVLSVVLYAAVVLPPKPPGCCSCTSKFLFQLETHLLSVLQRQWLRAVCCKQKESESISEVKALSWSQTVSVTLVTYWFIVWMKCLKI